MLQNEYAKALYELALEENKENDFIEYFDALIKTSTDSEFYDILTSPFIDLTKKKKLIDLIYSTFDKTFLNFIYVLLENNRYNYIKDIFVEYSNLILEHNDIVKIQVISAYMLNNVELIKLTKSLQVKYVNKKIELENIIDEKLIDGIKIISHGQSIDMSLKNSLSKLKESL